MPPGASVSPGNGRASPHTLSLLISLRDQRVLVEVRVDAGPAPFQSAVVEIDADAGYLYLDELAPERGHRRVEVGSTLDVRARINRVPARFQCKVEKIEVHDGVALYRVPLPDRVEHHQRRDQYRVPVGIGHGFTATVNAGAHSEPLPGEVHDLSLTGCALRLPTAESVDALVGRPDLVLDLSLGEGIAVTSKYEILHTTPLPRGGVLVGGRFIEPELEAERTIRRVTVDLERRNVRLRTR